MTENTTATPPIESSARFWCAVIAVAAGLAGLSATLPLPVWWRTAAVGVLVILGVGSAVCAWLRLPRSTVLVAVPTVSMASTTLWSASAGWIGWWHPTALLVIVSLGIGTAGALRLALFRRDGGLPALPRLQVPNVTPTRLAPWIVLTIAFVSWAASVGRLDHDANPDLGLLGSGAGLILCMCIALAVLAFLIAIKYHHLVTAVVAIGLVIVFERVTAPLITDAPIYVWTSKHLGVVDYIQQHSQLPPSWTDIYAQWPGMFAGAAWFGDLTGLDPLDLAHWFTPLIHVALAVVIGALALNIGLQRRAALCAVMIAELLNWVGQDYFAPQAWALVMAIGALALMLSAGNQTIGLVLAIVPFAAVTITHQLTPFWVLMVAIAWSILGRIQPRWFPAIYAVILGAYVFERRDIVLKFGLFSGSNPLANAQSNVVTGPGTFGRIFTEHLDKFASVSLWLLAGIAFLVMLRRQPGPWVPGAAAFASFALLGGQSYGGEAIFRVFLYSLAGCSVLVAPFVVSALDLPRIGRQLVASATVFVAMVGISLSALQGYLGGWSYIVVDRAQYQASRELFRQHPDGLILWTLAPAGFPGRVSGEYVDLVIATWDFDKQPEHLADILGKRAPDEADLKWLNDIAASRKVPYFIAFTVQAKQYLHYFGAIEPADYDALYKLLANSSSWRKSVDNDRTTVFEFVGDQP